MTTSFKGRLRRARTGPTAIGVTVLVVAALAPTASLAGARIHPPRARSSSSSVRVGIADEHIAMFRSPLWQQLNVGITRYIVPYDAAAHRNELNEATTYIGYALAAHQQVLVAFYHSYQTPNRMPSGAQYRSAVTRFMKAVPEVHEYEPWNEANRGNEPHVFDSPTPEQSAVYYRELRNVARHDTLVGLDILDNPNVGPTIEYISKFKRDLSHLHVPTPSLWGLHNYSDTNRFQSIRTRAVLKAVPGTLWLTETGGVVKYGTDFTNVHGAGLRRAARALKYMFTLTTLSSRIKRLYIYDWTGARPRELFDAGLTDAQGKPRPGYVVVCDQLLHNSRKCRVHVANN